MKWNADIEKAAATRTCFCIGPQNGDPVCPCKMAAHTERERGKMALEILAKMHRPRIRVKAVGRLV